MLVDVGKLYYIDYAELLAAYDPDLKYAYGQSLLSRVDLDREGQYLCKPIVLQELLEKDAKVCFMIFKIGYNCC